MELVEVKSVDAGILRRLFGRFATGVTAITVMADGMPRGMTANAFMSGSLDPPLILLSIAKNAKMHDAIIQAGSFGVSILAADQGDLAACFAGRAIPFCGEFEFHAEVPVIAASLAWLVARVDAAHVVGDHTLFVGEVRRLGVSEREAPPLAYYSGAFRGIGELAHGAAHSLDLHLLRSMW